MLRRSTIRRPRKTQHGRARRPCRKRHLDKPNVEQTDSRSRRNGAGQNRSGRQQQFRHRQDEGGRWQALGGSDGSTCAETMRLDHSPRHQISERSLAVFINSQFAKSSLLVLITVALTTSAYAPGGGHGGSNGSKGSQGANHPVHSSTAIVSKHEGKTLAHHSIVSKQHAHPQSAPPIVRDHRGSDDGGGGAGGGPGGGGGGGRGGREGGRGGGGAARGGAGARRGRGGRGAEPGD